MTPSATELIRKRIESFVLGLDEMIRAASLEVVRQGLLGPGVSPSPTRQTKGRLARFGARRSGMARAAEHIAPVTARAKGRKPAASARRVTHTKRTGDQLDALATGLLRYIAKHPGQRMEQIAAGMKVASKELALPIQKLKSEGRLKTKGQRRATAYYAR